MSRVSTKPRAVHAVARERRQVRPGVGLAGRDDELDRCPLGVDDVAPDDDAGVARVGQLLLDDRVGLVAEVTGRDRARGARLLELRAVALAVVVSQSGLVELRSSAH